MLDSPDRPASDDAALEALAREAGVSPEWKDTYGADRVVSAETLRSILAAMELPAATVAQIADSRARLRADAAARGPAPLLVASVGKPLELPFSIRPGARGLIEYEQGGAAEFVVETRGGRAILPAFSRVGYHRLSLPGGEATLAIAPARCFTIDDIAPNSRLWGLTAQVHGLRRPGDGGVGDFTAVEQLACAAARRRCDALALSPTHALFSADTHHYTPYSPSSRLFLNATLADPAAVFDEGRVAQARAQAMNAGEFARLESLDLIDWPAAAHGRLATARALFEDFRARELSAPENALTRDFSAFRSAGGLALERHACFEALHAWRFQRDFKQWRWRDWPAELQDANSAATQAFATANAAEIEFHAFLQWLASRSLRRAHGGALAAGMRIGLIADLAIGMNDGGSQAWSAPHELLLGLSVGAPPDPLAPKGQNWGLTTFSPRALRASGYASFIATLRAAMRHAGGVRIDHVMGLARLWLTPEGLDASEGAYVAYPFDDLLRLVALESHRHQAIVIGEDLGTVPEGLRETLSGSGAMGMRVLQFERGWDGFHSPHWYPCDAIATTSTHDTATMAGWWSGCDLVVRAETNQLPPNQSQAEAEDERAQARTALWRAFCASGVTQGDAPAPGDPARAVDAAVAFVSLAPAKLLLAPLEDVIGCVEQPNLPGTIDEHPNWRRRYPCESRVCLDSPDAGRRLHGLSNRT